ncbi:hypothetical protein Nepgr_010491 [Nepenthes gracilis]|uniref:Uncharacterized protein n=1 Tax=Nepenthes gracilis TaxID=150966 RepID=A0AAD3SD90_NEPGR|nr:hypothetical protein Nepgr_010491 [Nepenthes gracilis]
MRHTFCSEVSWSSPTRKSRGDLCSFHLLGSGRSQGRRAKTRNKSFTTPWTKAKRNTADISTDTTGMLQKDKFTTMLS